MQDFKKIRSKNKLFIIIILLLIIIIPSQLLMFKKQLYFSYDALYHVERIKQYSLAILEGQIPPRLAPTLIYGYTYPLFVVNYHLPYIFAVPIMFITKDAVFAFKAIMSASFILSAVFVFLFFRKISSDFASLCGAVVYCYNPYRFASLYHRAAIGESLALAFLPLIFLGLLKIVEGRKYSVLFTALSVFAVITSHSLVLLIFSPLLLIYLLLFLNLDKRKFINIAIAFIWGFTLSAFQILPSLFEKQYMNFDKILSSYYQLTFVKFFQIYGVPIFKVDLNSYFQVGFVPLLILCLSFLILIKTRDKRVFAVLCIGAVTTFLITERSNLFWNHFSILRSLVFPWRLMSVLVFCSALLVIFLIDFVKVRFLRVLVGFVLIIVAFLSSMNYFIKSGFPWYFPPSETLTQFGENNPIWSSDVTFLNGPLIGGINPSDVLYLKNKPFDVSFEVNLKNKSNVLIRRIYFPGWVIEVNGRRKIIDKQDGFVSTGLEQGNSYVHVFFEETHLRKFANYLTLFSFVVLAFFLLKSYKLKANQNLK